MILIRRNAGAVVLMRLPLNCHSMEVTDEVEASTWQISLIGEWLWCGLVVIGSC